MLLVGLQLIFVIHLIFLPSICSLNCRVNWLEYSFAQSLQVISDNISGTVLVVVALSHKLATITQHQAMVESFACLKSIIVASIIEPWCGQSLLRLFDLKSKRSRHQSTQSVVSSLESDSAFKYSLPIYLISFPF